MTTTDHAQEAARHIDWTHEWQAEVGSTEETNLANAMLAQAHAALAVAEQLRIANLVALGSIGSAHRVLADQVSAAHTKRKTEKVLNPRC